MFNSFKHFSFSDRLRTMINVQGDSLGAGIVAHLSKKELAMGNEEDDPEPSTSDASSIDKSKLNGELNAGFDDEDVTPL